MRIHTDTLRHVDLWDAARLARVEMEVTKHGSKSRDHAFEVHLTGESKRRPNRRGKGGPDEYAATWDQWGVFLSVLFDADDGRTFEPSAPMTCTYYSDRAEFDRRTGNRFNPDGNDRGDETGYWPADYHGDHTFRYNGVPCQQQCTKCSAVQVWSPA
jgi:hypothetical protein